MQQQLQPQSTMGQDPQQMFDMFNNMMKMMMQQQSSTGGTPSSNMNSMAEQFSAFSAAGMPRGGNQPPQLPATTVAATGSSIIGASNRPNHRDEQFDYRDIEDRFEHSRSDMENFYQRMEQTAPTHVQSTRSLQPQQGRQPQLSSQVGRGFYDRQFENSQEQMLPSRSDFVEFDVHNQSQSFNAGETRRGGVNREREYDNNDIQPRNYYKQGQAQQQSQKNFNFSEENEFLRESVLAPPPPPPSRGGKISGIDQYNHDPLHDEYPPSHKHRQPPPQSYDQRGDAGSSNSSPPLKGFHDFRKGIRGYQDEGEEDYDSLRPSEFGYHPPAPNEDLFAFRNDDRQGGGGIRSQTAAHRQQQQNVEKIVMQRPFNSGRHVQDSYDFQGKGASERNEFEFIRGNNVTQSAAAPSMNSIGFNKAETLAVASDQQQSSYKRTTAGQSEKNPAAAASLSFDERPVKGMKMEQSIILPNVSTVNPFEELPIKSAAAGKRFDDLIEEQMRLEQGEDYDYSESVADSMPTKPKSFLKKGQRAFLSNAQHRSKAATGHIEAIEGQSHNDGNTFSSEGYSKPKPKKSTTSSSSSIVKARIVTASTQKLPQLSSSSTATLYLDSQYDEMPLSTTNGGSNNADKPKKKFLQRGKGKGGGVQGFKKEDELSKTMIEAEQQQQKKKLSRKTSSNNYDLLSVEGEDDDEEHRSSRSTSALGGQKKYQAGKYIEEVKKSSSNSYQFDDEEEWGETEVKKKPTASVANKKQSSTASVKREIVDSDADDGDEKGQELDNEEDPEEHYSKVVQKYFNKKPTATASASSIASQPQANSSVAGASNVNTNEAIDKLQKEISKFKAENERLKRQSAKLEDLSKALAKEKEQFTKQKEIEMLELEEWKKEEQKKIRNEKRISERQSKAVASMPNRKEREEIDGLKATIKKLQDDAKAKDQRFKLAMEQKKKQLDDSLLKNQELIEEIKHLEKQRMGEKRNAGAMPLNAGNKQTVAAAIAAPKPPHQNSSTQLTTLSSKRASLKMARLRNGGNHEEEGGEDDAEGEEAFGNSNTEGNDDEFERYENYNPPKKAGNKQQLGERNISNLYDEDDEKHHVKGDYEYDGQEEQEVEDDHSNQQFETYEDIINFNPYTNKGGVDKTTNNKKVPGGKASSLGTAAVVPSNVTNNRKPNNSEESVNWGKATDKSSKGSTAAGKTKGFPSGGDSEPIGKNSKGGINTTAVAKTNGSNSVAAAVRTTTGGDNGRRSSFPYDISTLSKLRKIAITMLDVEIDSKQFTYDLNHFYQAAIKLKKTHPRIVSQTTSKDGKVHTQFDDGRTEIVFENGLKREIYPNSYSIVRFVNNDIKQTMPDSTVIYLYADADTTHITLPNKINIYRFPNDQIEIHFPSGLKEIRYADLTEKCFQENGEEITYFKNGTTMKVDLERVRTVTYVDGSEEVVYSDQEYDDDYGEE